MKLTYVESVGVKKLEQYEKTVEFVDDDGVETQRNIFFRFLLPRRRWHNNH